MDPITALLQLAITAAVAVLSGWWGRRSAREQNAIAQQTADTNEKQLGVEWAEKGAAILEAAAAAAQSSLDDVRAGFAEAQQQIAELLERLDRERETHDLERRQWVIEVDHLRDELRETQRRLTTAERDVARMQTEVATAVQLLVRCGVVPPPQRRVDIALT